MDAFHFSNALGYTFEQLADMHNASFTGYFVPIDMTPKQVADFWRANHIDANRCVVMHDTNHTFIGMARMGTRGERGWCGGFGIVPAFRGTGASRLLADEMVRVARETGLRLLQLEVLTQNIRARKLYERVGFRVQRRLFGLEIATAALPGHNSSSVERLSIETFLFKSQQNPVQPCWSLEPISFLVMNAEVLAVPGPDGQPNIFVVQHTNDTVRILATLLQNQLTDVAVAELLRTVAMDAKTVRLWNEPEESQLFSYTTRLGFTEMFSQYEMTLEC